MERIPFWAYRKAAVKMLLAALVIAFLVAGRELLVPLFVSLFFTFLLLPVSKKLERWKFPRWLAILLSILIAIAVLGGAVYFIWIQVKSFADDWPELHERLNVKIKSAQSRLLDFLNVDEDGRKDWMSRKVTENLNVPGIFLNVFSATGSFFASLGLIPVYVFLLTLYQEKLIRFAMMLAPPEKKQKILSISRKITGVSQHYLKGIFLDISILSVLASIGYAALGIRHAVLFGVLSALLNVIPYIGVLIGSTLPALMALLTKDEIGYALGAVGVAVVVQFIDNHFISPNVIGGSVSLNPLAAIVALVLGAMIWGVPGMILSIPVTGMAKVICDNITALKPWGFLLGEDSG